MPRPVAPPGRSRRMRSHRPGSCRRASPRPATASAPCRAGTAGSRDRPRVVDDQDRLIGDDSLATPRRDRPHLHRGDDGRLTSDREQAGSDRESEGQFEPWLLLRAGPPSCLYAGEDCNGDLVQAPRFSRPESAAPALLPPRRAAGERPALERPEPAWWTTAHGQRERRRTRDPAPPPGAGAARERRARGSSRSSIEPTRSCCAGIQRVGSCS